MQIYILLLCLVALLVFNLFFNNKNFGAPAVVITISFLFSAMWATAYQDNWNINIHSITVTTVIINLVFFSFACIFTNWLDERRNKNRTVIESGEDYFLYNYEISNGKCAFILIINIFITIMYIRRIKSGTNILDLSNAIYSVYSQQSELNIPIYLRVMLAFIRGGGYWFSLAFVLNIISRKKVHWLSLIIIAVSVACNSLTGSRGTAACIILSIPSFFLLFYFRNHKFRMHVSFKYLLMFIALLALALWAFPRVNALLGRVSKTDPIDYLATYIGAEIANLDAFLTNNHIPINTGTWGRLTFASLISTVGKYLGINLSSTRSAYAFRYTNGYFMGNVFTCLYEPLYDFGFLGCILVMVVYGYSCQKIYRRASCVEIRNRYPISILLYGYLLPVVAVSFFAWWIGIYIFSTSFIYIVISWILLNYFFFRIKFI